MREKTIARSRLGDLSLPRMRSTTLIHAEPQLYVADVMESSRFYTERLGFDIAFSYGEPPFYLQVYRQGARLNLRHSSRPAFDPEFRNVEADPLTATIVVDDAEALFREFEQRRYAVRQTGGTSSVGACTSGIRPPWTCRWPAIPAHGSATSTKPRPRGSENTPRTASRPLG